MTPLEKALIEEIIDYINQRRIITFWYDGYERLVEPYLIGELNSKTQTWEQQGRIALRGFMRGGYTSKPANNDLERWRLYELRKIKDLLPTQTVSTKLAYGYDPVDDSFKRIIAAL